MKKFKHFALLLLAAVVVFGCSKYDDTELRNDVSDLQSRVEKLETWCATTNTQISALQGLVDALEKKDYVTGVTPIMEGTKEVGYTITFTKSKPITILHGKDGVDGTDGKDGITPIIGVAKDTDGHYYWTVKIGDAAAVWMTDASGNKIRTTGDKGDPGQPGTPGADGEDGQPGVDGADGHSPVLSVAEFEGRLYWKVDGNWLLNGGNKVPATGDKGETGATGTTGAQGDAIFAKDGIDYTTDPENVIFTLADGVTKITLPKSSAISIGFDSYDTFYCSETNNEVTIVLPIKLKAADYNVMAATISNENGTSMDIQTRTASTDTWGVEVIKPTFAADGALVSGSAKVKLILPQDKTNYKALLKVTLIDSKGKEYSASRMVWFKADKDVNVVDNTTGGLSGKIANPTTVKQLSVIGAMDATDFTYIKDNMQNLEVLDLSRTIITEIPEGAMAFYNNPDNGWNYTTNTTLKTIILPETLTTIGNSAFAMCANLQEMNMPKSVRTLGRWMFEGCNALEEVEIPKGVIELPASAFYGAGIKRITIPSSVTTIGGWAFNLCRNLTSVTIPATVTSLGKSIFEECENLESAEIMANVDALGGEFFYKCSKLRSVKLSTSINTLSNNAFAITGFTEFNIPAHVTMLGSGAFCENVNLRTVTIPADIQMDHSAFAYCSNLKNVTIPKGITELGAEMFRDCTALESIVLPSTITTIRDRAFQGCSALTSLTCKATTIPTLSGHNSGGENYNFHFYGINSSCTLKRPTGTDYSAWSDYFKGGIENL